MSDITSRTTLTSFLAVKQFQIFVIGQAGIAQQTFEKAWFNDLPPMRGNREMKLHTVFDQNVMTPRHASHTPAVTLEGFDVLFGCGAGSCGIRGFEPGGTKDGSVFPI